ncbi:hypothetical protein LTR56_021794 [Elasticomyces elasticus]|nr:hypothetical protein LTR56_021794 [Elasticomyces elasticus]KAK3630550.1 hypothetical protein LTR22_021466 [Elasticomyces elasticus]KAK5748470.1 hypothetical protein LTS12_021489 [Elasticomyces elasticus]
MPQMPEKEPEHAYTASERTGAIWEAMEDAEDARRDTEFDLVLSDSEDETTTANSPFQPAALPPPQPSTRANPSILPTVKASTKSGFSRIGSPRILCRCSCGCSHGYYERKRDSVSQPHNVQDLYGAGGDAREQDVSRPAAEKQNGHKSAEKEQTVIAQDMETASSIGKTAIRGQGDLAMPDGFPPTSYKGKGKRRMSEDGNSPGAALATSSKRARASEGEEAVWRDRWVPAGPLQLRWGGLRD